MAATSAGSIKSLEWKATRELNVNLGSNFSPRFELKSLLIQGTLDEVLAKVRQQRDRLLAAPRLTIQQVASAHFLRSESVSDVPLTVLRTATGKRWPTFGRQTRLSWVYEIKGGATECERPKSLQIDQRECNNAGQ